VRSEIRDIIEKNKEEELAQGADMQLVGEAVSGGKDKQKKKVKNRNRLQITSICFMSHSYVCHDSFICVT